MILGGRFRIIRKLGEGGSAEVYLVEDIKTQKKYALKLLKYSKFLKAYELARKLNHPNIVKIYETGTIDGKTYVLTEYVDGKPLNFQISGLSLKDRIKIATQIIEALVASHKKGIMHKDLKPENILLTKDLKVKLTDFGLARDEGTGLTKTGELAGTPAYISPEELKGEKPTKSSDIFSLGVILYELFTGTHPFRKDTISQTMYNIINKNPKPPDKINTRIPSHISGIIQKCLLKTPRYRYKDAQELRNDWITRKKVKIWYPMLSGIKYGLVFFALILSVVFLILSRYNDKNPAKVHINGPEVKVFNKSGRKLFTFKAGSDITAYLLKDINNDGKNEVIVGTGYLKTTSNKEKVAGKDTGSVYVLDYTGKFKRYFGNPARNIYDKPAVFMVDMLKFMNDSSGCILVGERCGKWFPYIIRNLCPNKKDARLRQYWHSGWIFDAVFDDVNNDGTKDIVAGGINNDLGMKPVFFALNGRGFDAQSPPWFGKDISEEYGTLFYSILPGSNPVDEIKKIKPAIYSITTRNGKIFYISNLGVLLKDTILPVHHTEIFNTGHSLINKMKMASTLSKNGKILEAIKILKITDRPYEDFLYPVYASLYLYRGIIENEANEVNAAIKDFERAARIDTGYAAPYLRLGFLYFNKDEYIKAQNVFEKAYYLSSDQWAYFYSMMSSAMSGNFKEALSLYNDYAKKNDAFYIYFSSLLFYIIGEPDSTLSKVQLLKRKHPKLIVDENYPACAVYIDLNRLDQVDTTIIKKYPDLLGSYLYRQGKYEEARRILIKSISEIEKEQNSILSKIQLWRTQHYLYLIYRKIGRKEQISGKGSKIHIKAVVL